MAKLQSSKNLLLVSKQMFFNEKYFNPGAGKYLLIIIFLVSDFILFSQCNCNELEVKSGRYFYKGKSYTGICTGNVESAQKGKGTCVYTFKKGVRHGMQVESYTEGYNVYNSNDRELLLVSVSEKFEKGKLILREMISRNESGKFVYTDREEFDKVSGHTTVHQMHFLYDNGTKELSVEKNFLGDYNGDGKKETMWILPYSSDANGNCGNTCNALIRFSDPEIPDINLGPDIYGGNLENGSDLNDDGIDEVTIVPFGDASEWSGLLTFSFHKGKWTQPVKTFSVYGNGEIAKASAKNKVMIKGHVHTGDNIIQLTDTIDFRLEKTIEITGVQGDFDGDSIEENLEIRQTGLGVILQSSNSNLPPLTIENCNFVIIKNEDDLDGDGSDEISIIPTGSSHWFIHKLSVYSYKNNAWKCSLKDIPVRITHELDYVQKSSDEDHSVLIKEWVFEGIPYVRTRLVLLE